MATIFKNFQSNDIASTRTILNESVPVTGTIVSGTYSDNNIKNYAHGMFQSVYDYPYLSSSANQIFDMTVGYSSVFSDTANTQNSKKLNIYNQYAQLLVGYDTTGSIKGFTVSNGTAITKMIFMNFARLLSKDEIKKESFIMTIATGGVNTAPDFANLVEITDSGALANYRVDSPVGEYGYLYSGSTEIGKLYYQAGIAAFNAGVFDGEFGAPAATYDTSSVAAVLTGSAITASCDGLRNRLNKVAFNNTTELNSTIYFCRINHSDFNYSSNPTYLSGSKLRVKNNATDTPVSYISTVGMYSADNELLAVAKLSEPLKKDPTNEITLRVRLDY